MSSVIYFICFCWIVHRIRKARKERAQEELRKNTPCKFDNGLTETDFNFLVKDAAPHIKRLTSLTSNGSIVYGTVRSQSGITTWKFNIDFNDYGNITGKYWLRSENTDSDIPYSIANHISNAISSFFSMQRHSGTSFSPSSFVQQTSVSLNSIKCPYCNGTIPAVNGRFCPYCGKRFFM